MGGTASVEAQVAAEYLHWARRATADLPPESALRVAIEGIADTLAESYGLPREYDTEPTTLGAVATELEARIRDTRSERGSNAALPIETIAEGTDLSRVELDSTARSMVAVLASEDSISRRKAEWIYVVAMCNGVLFERWRH